MGRGNQLGEFEEIVLLAVARLDGRGYGASIHEEILDATERDVSIASVYVTLSRLGDKGWVKAAAGLVGDGGSGRPRKTFRITESGISELRRSRLVQARLWDGLSFDPLGSHD